MNSFKTFLMLISLLLLGISCTEEISDELKNTDEAATVSNSRKAVGKKMKLKHLMDENLSYFIHGSNGIDYPCEIEASGKNFDASKYSKSDYTNNDVVDCILEVEELDLFFEGVEYELNIDEYLCEYIQYEPFKFFQYPVGATRQKEYVVECSSDCAEADVSNFCAGVEGTYLTYNGGTSIDGSDPVILNKSKAQCKFDYTDDENIGENCDTGYIKSIPVSILPGYRDECLVSGVSTPSRANQTDCEAQGIWTAGSCSGGTSDGTEESSAECSGVGGTWTAGSCSEAGRGNEQACITAGSWEAVPYCRSGDIPSTAIDANIIDVAASSEHETIYCGGSSYNCMNGPAQDHLTAISKTGVIYENKDLTSFTKSWAIEPPIQSDQATNRYIANYSRYLADQQDNPALGFYATPLTSSNGLVGNEVETLTPAPQYPYDSTDSDQRYQTETVDYNNDGNDDYTVYATHPFLGVTSNNNNARKVAKPYYAFNCLDKALDIKAQIRLFIREWDRRFDHDDQKMNYVTDYDDPSTSTRLIDNSGYWDTDSPWNDISDWDDFFYLENPPSGYSYSQGVFSGGNASEIANEVNPGECYPVTADNETNCGLNSDQWVHSTGKCYDDDNATGDTSRYDCENSTTNKWFWGGSGHDWYYRNFPWTGI